MERFDIMVAGMLVTIVVVYLLSWGAFLLKRNRAGQALMCLGWLANAAMVLFNWGVAGEPPLGNMYHVMVFLSLCFVPLYAVFAARSGLGWTACYFAFTSALPLIGALCMEKNVEWRRMPALQSPWFVPHVMTYMISYALAAVSVVLMIVKRIRQRLGLGVDASVYEEACELAIRLSFPLMTFGMLSGALWAEEAWGTYWSWDPKETWSLITWTLYVVYLHVRRDSRLSRYADWAVGLAFVALLVTFLLVNLLPKLASGLHAYA